MDQRKLPAGHYNYLKAYWAKPGISYEYSAFMDSHFDFVGFWVGECALDTLMPYWRTAAVVSERSQFTHIVWATISLPNLSLIIFTPRPLLAQATPVATT